MQLYLFHYFTTEGQIKAAKGSYTGMVPLELQKAFIPLIITAYIVNFQFMGVKSADWFKSY